MIVTNFMLKENNEDWLTRMLGLNSKNNTRTVIIILYLLLAFWLILLMAIFLQ
jgi:hypothetical protein